MNDKMSSKPSISIIMPVYNVVDFLPMAMASIFAQTITDWELIAIDDASTDGSWQYLQRIDDPRVRIFRNDRNRNVPYTVNRGIDMARGKWIGKMDSDDIISPKKFELQLDKLESCSEIDVLGCGTIIVDRDLNIVSAHTPPTEHHVITKTPCIFMSLTFGALLGKADWWRKWRIDERIVVSGHEFDLYLRSYQESIFSNVPEFLYVYRFVGHTRTYSKLMKSLYYRSLSLILNGYRLGLPVQTTVALLSMLPRPLLYAIKFLIGSKTGLNPSSTPSQIEEGVKILKEIITEISKIEVPLKSK
jgi:glycosyltransferase involved in cell wall biosynthesis